MIHSHTQLNQKRGQVMLVVVIIFLFIFMTAGMAIASISYREYLEVVNTAHSTQSFYTAEALEEDVAYRFVYGMDVSSNETLTLGGADAEATVTDIEGGKIIDSVGDLDTRIRKATVELSEGSGASFFYGLQTGEGGFVIENNASVIGNVYSNGTIEGANSNLIDGDVVSAGSSGLISDIEVNNAAYAHRIEDSQVGGDAYYVQIHNTTVGGTEYPDSDDQEPLPFPISDEQIEDWEDDAEAGGTYSGSCPYDIDSDTTLGPIKIECNVEISGGTITLQGPVWVLGDITFQNSPTIQIDSSLTDKSVAVIADNPADRTSGSRIQLENSVDFNGADGNSYILLVSQNESAETGGGVSAIEMQNNATGDLLLYAAHGEINLENNVDLKEVTAYRVRLENRATVEYETGLANLIFTSGPSGGYEIKSWDPVW